MSKAPTSDRQRGREPVLTGRPAETMPAPVLQPLAESLAVPVAAAVHSAAVGRRLPENPQAAHAW
jgi:hypothetical protein